MTTARRKPDRTCDVCGGITSSTLGVCRRTAECRRAYSRRLYARDRLEVNVKRRMARLANQERDRDYYRRYYAKHRGKKRGYGREYEQNRRALRGGLPQWRQRKHLANAWAGGRDVYCCVPGCGRAAGWRKPSQIKKNTHGFYCLLHRRGLGSRSVSTLRGKYEYCSLPGCGRSVGWRTASEIKRCKTGFRCSVHRYVRLPKLKE